MPAWYYVKYKDGHTRLICYHLEIKFFTKILKKAGITKTCPCNVYPLEPHFDTVQLSRCFERTRICALRVVARRGLSLLASDSRVTRKLRAILSDHLANAQNHLSNARRESDMCDLYNLNNLARKVCCKKCFMLNFHARLIST